MGLNQPKKEPVAQITHPTPRIAGLLESNTSGEAPHLNLSFIPTYNMTNISICACILKRTQSGN